MRSRHQLLVDLLAFTEAEGKTTDQFRMTMEEAEIVLSDSFLSDAASLLDLREEGRSE